MTQARRGVALGIKIDQESLVSALGDCRTQVDRGRCFANATFLVRNANNPGQPDRLENGF